MRLKYEPASEQLHISVVNPNVWQTAVLITRQHCVDVMAVTAVDLLEIKAQVSSHHSTTDRLLLEIDHLNRMLN